MYMAYEVRRDATSWDQLSKAVGQKQTFLSELEPQTVRVWAD